MPRVIVGGMPEYLTVAEVADHLRVHVKTVRRWIAAGTLPATKIGRDYRVPRAALEPAEEVPS